MSTTQVRPSDHPNVPNPRIGVLLVNLGTPDAPTAPAVRRYLAEFLSDKRVVELPRAVWLPILHGIILNTRPGKTAQNYQKIWRSAENESPLRYYTRLQCDGLSQHLGDDVVVGWAMRYGTPSIADRINEMKSAGVTRLMVLPLYPQYSASTTASVTDAVFDALKAMRWQPSVRIAPPFYDEPAYIAALAASAGAYLADLDWVPEKILLSFHGIPQRYFDSGDPYHCHCQKTARLLREKMQWTDDFAPLVFQSKFGRDKWLEPAADETIRSLGSEGVKNIAMIAPSFVSDCIETLEELDIAGREIFMAAGGEQFATIPCLNDGDEFIAAMEVISRRELAGWI